MLDIGSKSKIPLGYVCKKKEEGGRRNMNGKKRKKIKSKWTQILPKKVDK